MPRKSWPSLLVGLPSSKSLPHIFSNVVISVTVVSLDGGFWRASIFWPWSLAWLYGDPLLSTGGTGEGRALGSTLLGYGLVWEYCW